MAKLTTTEIYGDLIVHGLVTTDSNNLKIRDVGSLYYLNVVSDSSPLLTADRNLTVDIGNSNKVLGLFADIYIGTATNTGSITIASNDTNARSITLSGNLTTSGAYGITLAATNTTSVTLPTAGILAATTGTTKSIIIPSGPTEDRDTDPPVGYFRYNSSLHKFEGFKGSPGTWGSIGGGATGGASDEIFIENDQEVTVNYSITTGRNAGTFGPVTINPGVVVSIPEGSVWSIV